MHIWDLELKNESRLNATGEEWDLWRCLVRDKQSYGCARNILVTEWNNAWNLAVVLNPVLINGHFPFLYCYLDLSSLKLFLRNQFSTLIFHIHSKSWTWLYRPPTHTNLPCFKGLVATPIKCSKNKMTEEQLWSLFKTVHMCVSGSNSQWSGSVSAQL